MTDILERLRDTSGRHISGLYDLEAANEIERRRDLLGEMREARPGGAYFQKWEKRITEVLPN